MRRSYVTHERNAMQRSRRLSCVAAVALALCGLLACLGPLHGFESIPADDEQNAHATADPQQESALFIENEGDLRDTFPGDPYEVHFTARGGVPVLHWRVERGAIPPGMKFEDNGLLHGTTERPGEFQFTVSVRDGGKPQQAVEKQFILRVHSGLTVSWHNPARVNNNRIEGTVDVANLTPDDIDLTFIVLAVAANNRATAIGYQHFSLKRGTTKELPFGENLPNGGYIVHVDGVGEVAPKKLIYHERLETPAPLQVTVGP